MNEPVEFTEEQIEFFSEIARQNTPLNEASFEDIRDEFLRQSNKRVLEQGDDLFFDDYTGYGEY